MMDNKTIQQAVKDHLPFTCMLNELIKSLLDAKNIKYHVVESRTKEVESLKEKIERKKIKDFTKEIHDITGVRVILYYQTDLDIVEELISKNFTIDYENSINKENLFQSNEFGYLSRHFIIKINKERKKLLEWKRFSDLKAEIQVRTVLQHSWASISHELSYKKNYDIPKELSRKLFRLAGLFELADEQFLEIRREHEALLDQLNKMSSTELSKEEINQLTLRHNLSLPSGVFHNIKESAERSGFIKSDFYDFDIREDRSLSSVKYACNLLGINTIGQLEKMLSDSMADIEKLFKELILGNDSDWHGNIDFYLLLAVLLNLDEKQLTQVNKTLKWDKEIWTHVYKTIKKLKNQI